MQREEVVVLHCNNLYTVGSSFFVNTLYCHAMISVCLTIEMVSTKRGIISSTKKQQKQKNKLQIIFFEMTALQRYLASNQPYISLTQQFNFSVFLFCTYEHMIVALNITMKSSKFVCF